MTGRITHRLHRGSVLPKIEASRTEDGGAQLFAARPGAKDLVMIVLFAIAGAASLWIAIYGDLDLGRAIQSGATAMVGLGAAVSLFKSHRERSRLHHAALYVRPWPIRLGDTVSASLHVVMADSVPPEVAAAVQCRESVTCSQGKYAKTNSTILYSTQLPASSAWTFDVPDHCPPSLAVASNAVRWELTTIVRAEGLDLPVTFELLVLPEVVS